MLYVMGLPKNVLSFTAKHKDAKKYKLLLINSLRLSAFAVKYYFGYLKTTLMNKLSGYCKEFCKILILKHGSGYLNLSLFIIRAVVLSCNLVIQFRYQLEISLSQLI